MKKAGAIANRPGFPLSDVLDSKRSREGASEFTHKPGINAVRKGASGPNKHHNQPDTKRAPADFKPFDIFS